MGYTARLTYKSRKLMLDGSGRLSLSDTFVPPSVIETPMLAGGSSANTYGGAERIGLRANNNSVPLPVKATGSSGAECDRAMDELEAFLRLAGDPDDPVCFEWRSDDNVGFEPLWGQFGNVRRLEVVHADPPRRDALYGKAELRGITQLAQVVLQVAPYALGVRQRLATASGGVISDSYGAADGVSRGMIVAEATTNKMTNPVYGHGTWNNGWSSDALLVVSQNTDARFLLPGTTSSAKITSQGSGREHYQSINAGNTNDHVLSCYAKRQDGAAISSSDVVLYYNTTLITTFTSMGDGWYRLSVSVAGINAATNTGAQIKSGYTVYLTGWQFEEKSYDYPTPLCYGDLLGCSWSGTAHASTSSRTAGLVSVTVASDTFNLGMGTFRAVVRMNQPSTDFTGSTIYICHGGASSFDLQWDETTEVWRFSDGSNNSELTDTAFSAGDTFILHATWKPGAILLYVNGSAGTAPGGYSPPNRPSIISIGSTTTSGFHGNQTFLDFAIYDQAMTAAEVAADYANILQVANDNQRLAAIPHLWNKDGDGIVDNCDDSSRDNWAAARGIPGSAPAVTEFDITRSYNSTNELLISNIVHDHFLPPANTMFFDQSGTVDANSCGGEYLEYITISSGATYNGSGLTDQRYAVFAGKEVIAIVRASATASTYGFIVAFRYGSVSTSVLTSESKNITTTGTGNYFLYRTNPFVMPDKDLLFLDSISLDGTNQYYYVTIGTAASTYRCDYVAIVSNEQLFVLRPSVATASGTQSFLIKGEQVISYVSGVPEATVRFDGRAIELVPDKTNILMSFLGDDDDGPTITRTLTYNSIYVTPRWALL